MDQLCSDADIDLTEKDCTTGKKPVWSVADCKKDDGEVAQKLKEIMKKVKENPSKAVCDILNEFKQKLEDKCEKKDGEMTNVCMEKAGWDDEDDEILQNCDKQDDDDDITSSGYIIDSNVPMFCVLLYMIWISAKDF